MFMNCDFFFLFSSIFGLSEVISIVLPAVIPSTLVYKNANLFFSNGRVGDISRWWIQLQ